MTVGKAVELKLARNQMYENNIKHEMKFSVCNPN